MSAYDQDVMRALDRSFTDPAKAYATVRWALLDGATIEEEMQAPGGKQRVLGALAAFNEGVFI